MKIFALFLFPCFCFCNEDFCRETRSSLLLDRVLAGRVIKTFLTRGVSSCAHKCLAQHWCSSYNYEMSAAQLDGVCELNNGGNEDHQQNLTEKHGFVFAQVQRKQVRKINDSVYHYHHNVSVIMVLEK